MNSTASIGTVEHVDPATLVIATNIRADVTLDKEFVDSIRANGVIQPIVAVRTGEQIEVRFGQRRTRAAQDLGLATIPVYIVDADQTDTAQRIIDQLVENDQRAALTEIERVDAWRQLELEGLSATAIAKRTGTKRDRVKTGLSVAGNDTGKTLTQSGIPLDLAAQIMAFDDDDETVAALVECAESDPGYLPVALKRAQQDRERAAVVAVVAAEEAAKGRTILTEQPEYGGTWHRITDLRTAEGEWVDRDTIGELIEGRADVAAYVSHAYDGPRTTYYTENPGALGLVAQERTTYDAPTQSGPMTDEQKAERKTLIANNKEWDAAEAVRREWLPTLIGRKALPRDAAKFTAWALTGAASVVTRNNLHASELAHDVLGIKKDGYGSDAITAHIEAHPNRAQHITLGVILAAIEETTSRDTWRRPDQSAATYLRTLAAWGYTLSPVEKIAAQVDVDENDVTAKQD